MCGGGGGGGGGQDVFAAAQADQKRRDEEDRVAQQARDVQADADAKSVAARANYNANMGTAIKGAYGTGEGYFKRRGLTADPGYINEIINSITRKVPDLDTNPQQYYNEDAFAGGVSNFENQQRQKYNADVGTTFAPGFERSLIPDTAADSVVNSILGEQRGAATKALDFNKARGLLNDTGYGEATRAIGGQAAAGTSTLRNLANSVLGVDRQHLLDIRGEAGDAASNYGFGQPAPDLGGYRTRKYASKHGSRRY